MDGPHLVGGSSGSHWKFEAIRIIDDGADPYSTGTLKEARPLSVLIDYRRKGTLVRPLIDVVDPAFGHYSRTRVTGSFQGLLDGTCVADEHNPEFEAISFESAAFAAWFNSNHIKTARDERYRLQSIGLVDPEIEKHTVEGLGDVEVVSLGQFDRGDTAHQLRTRTTFGISFDRLRSLAEVIELCLGLELLFGFLVGVRPPMPTFDLMKPKAPKGEKAPRPTSHLTLGGVFAREEPIPHWLHRLHTRGRDEANLGSVLKAFMADPTEMMSRIYAVKYARWFGASLNDQFATVMPVFEEYVKSRFKEGDELNFEHLEQAFWDHVNAAPNPDLAEFAKKHVDIKKRKSASLPMLIERAIASVNAEGFIFGSDLPKRINKRRATMFHRAFLITDKSASEFHEEKLAVTAILMLATLRDLGVDLTKVAAGGAGLQENFRFTPRRTGEDVGN